MIRAKLYFFIKITIILSLFSTKKIKAQDINAFYFQINRASNLSKTEKIDSAIIVYENAFEMVNYVNTALLKKVLKLSKKNKDKKRIKSYSDRIKKQLKGTMPELNQIIDSLHFEDQRVRRNKYSRASNYQRRCLKKNCDKSSKKYIRSKSLVDEWKETDSTAGVCLLNLFEKHGYLGEELIGKKYSSVYLILLHFDRDTNNILLRPILDKALKEGKITPLHYAYVIDRHSINDQTFWTWFDLKGATKLPLTETDIQKTIELRESIGMYGSKIDQKYIKGSLRIQNYYNY